MTYIFLLNAWEIHLGAKGGPHPALLAKLQQLHGPARKQQTGQICPSLKEKD